MPHPTRRNTLIQAATIASLWALQTPPALAANDALPPVPANAPYKNAALPVEQRAADLLGRMSLAEKIGQMTQGERDQVNANAAADRLLGSVLSGGGSAPRPNVPASWAEMIDGYQKGMETTRLKIPLIYGIDAVHGHQSVEGATIFPHLMALAATRDAALVRRVGEVTAREMAATGIYWTFSPMVSVTQDLRWGRTYETFGEDQANVVALSRAYAQGLMAPVAPGVPRVLPTAKHFIGDGATAWGTSTGNFNNVKFQLDQGDVTATDLQAVLDKQLPPYKAMVDAGVMSVMTSFSSWNGKKVHGEKSLVTDVLKDKLGFKGFVISDWDAIQQLPGSFKEQVTAAINAGVDMAMVPNNTSQFISTLSKAVESGAVSQARIDDAVLRILRTKLQMGLFEQSRATDALAKDFGSDAHRAVAREAVAKSLTLLKNQGALPIAKTGDIFVAGEFADDVGVQAGGWTLQWQGVTGNEKVPGGTSIVDGLKQVLGKQAKVRYKENGKIDGKAAVGIVVVGEAPYAEGAGDRDSKDLALRSDDQSAINALRERVDKLVVVVVAGRPVVLGDAAAKADVIVMAYLPGSEGAGVADVLLGDKPFTGRLPMGWPTDDASLSRADLPMAQRCTKLQWASGFGLDVGGKALGKDSCAL
jgi:beta-glucosidase